MSPLLWLLHVALVLLNLCDAQFATLELRNGLMQEYHVKSLDELFNTIANDGDAYAQISLAMFYQKGDDETQPDEVKAAQLLQKAASQGSASAQILLGWKYWSGTGVSEDKGIAAEFWKLAEEQDDPDANYILRKLRVSMWANGFTDNETGTIQPAAKRQRLFESPQDSQVPSEFHEELAE
eukprot:gnl/TRDRNA2_/TRDRNA2_87808_c2_seq1.p1 gnl/TRDRNA2_/TRDRNA2_87808_c2~~gnl/TRDRNA2_/TRDRNA2_87808_c2_seq1.p1  ORF type:complete len:181 (-),score=39.68 gnl/TRDRNA2_/TRDRNA2_87808_c2_seq1:13-555(-)